MSIQAFDIDTASIIEENGDKFYIIPNKTIVYRGGNFSEMHENAFFGFNVNDVKQYGNVMEYKINKGLKVLAIMQMNQTSTLYQNAPSDIKHALDNAYGMSLNASKKIRNSEPKWDFAVVNYICKMGYQGYAINNLCKTEKGGVFHGELVICNSGNNIQSPKRKSLGDAPRLQGKNRHSYNDENTNSLPITTSISRMANTYDSPPTKKGSKSLFFDENESPNMKNSRNLNSMFDSASGGRKKKTKKRIIRKLKKSKRKSNKRKKQAKKSKKKRKE
jgi:hypothetical protein